MPQFPNVSSTYGAPMGRGGSALSPAGKVRLFRVRLNSGGYDSGGAWCDPKSELVNAAATAALPPRG